jgi:hypothetical protein
MSVARFGDASPLPPLPAGKLPRYQPQVQHKRPGVGKSPKIPYLAYQRQPRQVVYPPEGPQFFYPLPVFFLLCHRNYRSEK